MAPEPTSQLPADDSLRLGPRRRVLRYVRLAVLVVAALGFSYLYRRYELLTVPAEGCSPVLGIEPGTRLLLDTQPRAEFLYLDDLVVYQLPDGSVSFARISVPPGSAPGTLRTEEGYWLLGDNPACPLPDSRAHGTFAFEQIAARVLFPLRF